MLTKQLLVAIDFHSVENNTMKWMATSNRKKKPMQVCNNVTVSKWQNFHFWGNFNCSVPTLFT